MRVIGGKYRSRLLTWPDDAKHIRPTKDRIRESIFNALGDISGSIVLDLYAGSGAMGIEALSRDARFAYFVDINQISIKTVKGNLNSLKIMPCDYSITSIPDKAALEKFKQEGIQFDIVFLDPPYELGDYAGVISILLEDNLLKENGIIVTEANKKLDLPNDKFKKIKEYKYGEILVNICWR